MDSHPSQALPLAGKVALVTGSGRGIGLGCAMELARRGATVVLNDRPGSEDLPAAAEQIRALGREAFTVESDAFSRAGCETLVLRALESAGRIDVLVSNVAHSVRCDFLSYDPDAFERAIAATLTSGFHISQLVARHMAERGGGGKIVFISSVQALMPYARSVAYNAAKAGLNHMARTIAVELAPHRINVNVVEPGWTDTPGEHISFGSKALERSASALPLGRLATIEEIGRAAAFLCTPDADYITGAELRVDGGFIHKDCAPG